MAQAQPRMIAAWAQGHWAIKNSLHWIRDVTYDEDRHQLREGNGPHVTATLRNTAINLYASPATPASPPPYDITPPTADDQSHC